MATITIISPPPIRHEGVLVVRLLAVRCSCLCPCGKRFLLPKAVKDNGPMLQHKPLHKQTVKKDYWRKRWEKCSDNKETVYQLPYVFLLGFNINQIKWVFICLVCCHGSLWASTHKGPHTCAHHSTKPLLCLSQVLLHCQIFTLSTYDLKCCIQSVVAGRLS